MKSHDRLRIVFAEARQNWRAFAYVMQVHENHYIKRAGVAGIRARGGGNNCVQLLNHSQCICDVVRFLFKLVQFFGFLALAWLLFSIIGV
ncbi:hypothetical protein CQU42_10595 [Salmonella enterica]|nr:hypothetical protein [Salmonella enterica]EDG9585088.1 hypothetical protein [Salmonella enterica subsp. enterica serovar Give]EDK3381712.1 hypothetical protein [Salmonella enterica subsp. enterica serovar Bareilly]EHK3166400.1 hypothetical protein [Salmonella enterica subsp. enterica serovar Urbana]EAN3497389.1 hypothetical protein [Salmonella enterica]